MKKSMTYRDVTDSITDTLAELDGEEVAKIHNMICLMKIAYNETTDEFDMIDTIKE